MILTNLIALALLLIAVLALCGLTWWACVQRYDVRVAELQGKLDGLRRKAAEHSVVVRKEIIQLHHELGDLRREHRELMERQQALQGHLDLSAAARHARIADPAVQQQASGFADTLPMM